MNAFDVDLAGLLRVFGGHLYADPEVFVRELVQNAADAIVLRRSEEPHHRGRIVVRVSEDAIVFEDDGAGLDCEGIATALGRIGYSTKRDGAPRGTSGQFGIGLLSGFLVASAIVVTTRKRGAASVRWTGRKDGTWSVNDGDREDVGSTVRLELDAPIARERVRTLLRRYVRFLPIAIHLDDERIDEPAPWSSTEAAEAFAESRGSRVLAVLPIDAGALWIHAERAQPEGGRICLYQNGILIEDAARDLLPTWAGFVSGVIDAPSLSPTASRETYVRDGAASELAERLRDTLLRWLTSMPNEPRAFERLLALHATHLRGACAGAPELMAAIGDRIPIESNFGEVDLPTLRAAAGGDCALRVADSPQAFAHVAPLATAQGLPLVNASYVHDRPFVEAWARAHRVDLIPLDLASMEVLLRPAPELGASFSRVLARATALLEPLDVAPEIGRFEPSSLPAFLVAEPTGLRERARGLARQGSSLTRDLLANLAVARGDRGTRFVLNADNPLVAALPKADLELAGHVVRLLYAQSAMLVRRTFSVGEARIVSEDLARLLGHAVGVRGDWN
jgi:molecular chaperone HtpG